VSFLDVSPDLGSVATSPVTEIVSVIADLSLNGQQSLAISKAARKAFLKSVDN